MTRNEVAIEFRSNDREYFDWIENHPSGFVVNTLRSSPSSYLTLHRATCRKIVGYNKMARPGGYTERDYVKVCGPSVDVLRRWAETIGSPAGRFKVHCSLCGPL